MSDTRTVQWRRDASTSRSVRVLWALGAGTFLAAIGLVAFSRLFGLVIQSVDPALELGLGSVGRSALVAALAAVGVTIVALAVAGDAEARFAALGRYVPFGSSDGDRTELQRALDALVGAIVVGGFMLAAVLVIGGRIGNFLAAITLPLALVAIVLSVFLQSVGALDLENGAIYLYEPEEAIDLEVIDGVSARYVGDTAILKLSYAQPDGQYVQGPRRLVVPPRVARELEGHVGSLESPFVRRLRGLKERIDRLASVLPGR